MHSVALRKVCAVASSFLCEHCGITVFNVSTLMGRVGSQTPFLDTAHVSAVSEGHCIHKNALSGRMDVISCSIDGAPSGTGSYGTNCKHGAAWVCGAAVNTADLADAFATFNFVCLSVLASSFKSARR